MLSLSPRRALAPLPILAMIAGGLVAGAVVPQAADAGTAKATVYPLTQKLAGLSSVGQMVEADGKLFVSSGDSGSSVEVYSTSGKHLKSIEGQPGAWGMVVSPDGSTVYVADFNSDEISAINAGTLKATTAYEGTSCPESLAFAAGRLFFGYGCDGPNDGGVASVDLATSDPAVVAISGMYGPPMIRGAGSYLVASNSPEEITSYSVDSTGAATPLATTSSGDNNPLDMAITSDGKYVDVASGAPYNIYSFSLATMTQHLVYPGVAYPEAVAADPTGKYVAGGFESYDTTAMLYGENSTTVKWRRFTAGTDPQYWSADQSFDSVLPQTLTFSPNGSTVFGVVSHENVSGYYLFSSTISPKATSASVKVPSVGAGKRHTATAKVHAPKGTTVTFSLTTNGATKAIGHATTNAKGVAKKSFGSKYSGTVTASVPGSASLLPASKTVSFTSKSRTTAHFGGSFRLQHGMPMYTSWKKFAIVFKTTPAEYQRANSGRAERRYGGRWVPGKRFTGYSSLTGALVGWQRKPAPGEYRIVLSVKSDSSSRGSSATSKPFRMA